MKKIYCKRIVSLLFIIIQNFLLESLLADENNDKVYADIQLNAEIPDSEFE